MTTEIQQPRPDSIVSARYRQLLADLRSGKQRDPATINRILADAGKSRDECTRDLTETLQTR